MMIAEPQGPADCLGIFSSSTLDLCVWRAHEREALIPALLRGEIDAINVLRTIGFAVSAITQAGGQPCVACGRIIRRRGKLSANRAAIAVGEHAHFARSVWCAFCAQCAARLPDEEMHDMAAATLGEGLCHLGAAERGATFVPQGGRA